MSTTTRRLYADALAEAEAFRAMIPRHAYERWEFAGSLRRRSPDIGDIEHVIIPAHGDAPTDGLFPERVNLLWYHVDRLMSQGRLAKHIYANGFKWGEKMRGIDCGGVHHEIWTTVPVSWGAQLAIRTGPHELSKRLVTSLLQNYRRNKDGAVWQCTRCECEGREKLCDACEGTGLVPRQQIEVREEKEYFHACGLGWAEPEARR